jgi:acetolactate synthase-1/2/3 large subunit
LTGIPVVTTLMARGAPRQPSRTWAPAACTAHAAVAALQRGDLLIALATRFDDRVTGKLDSSRNRSHADIDPAEIGEPPRRRADRG